jgi:hypothetical protein
MDKFALVIACEFCHLELLACALRLVDLRTQGEQFTKPKMLGNLSPSLHPRFFPRHLCVLRDTYDFVINEQTALQGHVHQRILEPRRTVTAHAIGLAIERKNAAQVLVMTTKEEIQRRYDVLHTDLLQCATFSWTLGRLLIICSLHI